jgi:recombination protein RecT
MSKIDYSKSGQKMQDQSANNPQALVKSALREVSSYLDQKLPQLSQWITGGVDPRALVRFALLDMGADTYAAKKLRECTRESIYMSLLACAVSGLEPGALKGEAFLVPFAGKAQFMAGWKGLVKQARRSNEVVSLHPQVVYDLDTFDLDLGSGLPPVHKPLLRGQRGDIIGAYAVAKLVGSRASTVSYEVEWMDKVDLDAVRKVGNRGNADKESDAWKLWEDQMWRKAPIRRLAKRLPMGSDYYHALAVESAHESGTSEVPVIDIVTDGEASKSESLGEASASMRAQASTTDDESWKAEALAREAKENR